MTECLQRIYLRDGNGNPLNGYVAKDGVNPQRCTGGSITWNLIIGQQYTFTATADGYLDSKERTIIACSSLEFIFTEKEPEPTPTPTPTKDNTLLYIIILIAIFFMMS